MQQRIAPITSTAFARFAKPVGYAAILVALGLGLWAYTTPEMALNWNSLMALCGF